MRKFTFLVVYVLLANNLLAQVVNTLTVESNPSNSTFGYINSDPSDVSCHATSTNMIIADWTSSGTLRNWRSFLKFDLSAIPTTATIDSAFLSVYADPLSPSGNVGNPTWGTDNATGIYRIVDVWDTTTLTWDMQPGFSTTDYALLPLSTSTVENYVNVDVTAIVKDMFTWEGNRGFLFKHIQETTPLNSMIFYSPYAAGADIRTPLLIVKYTIDPTGISNANTSKSSIDLYPNPATTSVNINITKQTDEKLSMTVTDCTGRIVTTRNIIANSSQVNLTEDLTNYAKGLYLVNLRSNEGTLITKKLVIY